MDKLNELITNYLKYREKFVVSSKREQAALALADYVVSHQKLEQARTQLEREIIDAHRANVDYTAGIDLLETILKELS